MTTTASVQFPHEPTNYDEVYMQQSILFADGLKDLKKLRKQLYTAAEYFEVSYTKDNQEPIVLDSLKDYAVKALVNTVDHLGSVAKKVSDLLNDQVDKVSGAQLHLSSVEQRLRAFQEFIDHEGRSQQALVVGAPKYHKRYILPVGETMHGAFRTKSKYQGCSLDEINDWHEYRNAIQAKVQETLPQIKVRKARPPSPALEQAQHNKKISLSGNLPNRDIERRRPSPYQYSPHSISLQSSNPTTPNTSRLLTPSPSMPRTPNQALRRQQYISEIQKAEAMIVRDKGIHTDSEQQRRTTTAWLKAFLRRHRAKKDDHLDTYLDNNN